MGINRKLPAAYVNALNNASGDTNTIIGWLSEPTVEKGSIGIDISAAVYTGFITGLTITPATDTIMEDVTIDLAYTKATDGVSAVATNNDTLDVSLYAMADDAVEQRLMAGTQSTLTGTVAPIVSGQRFYVGTLDGALTVKVKLSAERADCYIPYKVSYRSTGAATITPTEVA